MIPQRVKASKIGECETCSKTDTKVIEQYPRMWMCEECVEKEEAAEKIRMSPENQAKRVEQHNTMARANSILERSKVIDMSIQVKADVFNAATVPAVELKQAIINDPEIPLDKKDIVYADTCVERYLGLKEAIFGKREELLQMENEMRMWQIQARQHAAKLSAELREKFAQADTTLAYPAKPVKSVKPAKEHKPKVKSLDKQALLDASKKFDVPMAIIQTLVAAKNLTPEWAAKHYLASTGGEKCECPACNKKVVGA